MNDRMRPPPERYLPDHDNRRAELLEAISAPPVRRRMLVPVVAAAAVAGVAAAGLSWLPNAPDEETLVVDDRRTTAPAGTAVLGGTEFEPAPGHRELTPAELESAFATCTADAEPGHGWEPAFGITLVDYEVEGDWSWRIPTTWVVSERDGVYRQDCVLGDSGLIASGGYHGPEVEYPMKDTLLLYALIDQKSQGVGQYTEPVATVTVQPEDGAEREAVLHEGHWFFPFTADVRSESEPREGTEAGELIGVPDGYIVRGYDADGELVHDSTTDGPFVRDCHSDPSGTEVVHGPPDADPTTCARTHEWRHP